MSDAKNEKLSKHIRHLSLLKIPILLLVGLNVFMLIGLPVSLQSQGVAVASTTDQATRPQANDKKQKKQKKNDASTQPIPKVELADLPQLPISNFAVAMQATANTGSEVAQALATITPPEYLQAANPIVGFSRHLKRLGNRAQLETNEQILHVVNPPAAGGAVHLRVNKQVVTLQPGESREFSDGPWRVEFHRGGSLGISTNELEFGSYEFQVDAQGWRLVKADAKTL